MERLVLEWAVVTAPTLLIRPTTLEGHRPKGMAEAEPTDAVLIARFPTTHVLVAGLHAPVHVMPGVQRPSISAKGPCVPSGFQEAIAHSDDSRQTCLRAAAAIWRKAPPLRLPYRHIYRQTRLCRLQFQMLLLSPRSFLTRRRRLFHRIHECRRRILLLVLELGERLLRVDIWMMLILRLKHQLRWWLDQ
jgi:hypothetical protein